MTMPQPYTPAIMRRASLVDVPAVARLATSARLPSEEQDATDLDPGHAQSAMRLMMAHHALEDGQVWVAEQADGTLLMASIWLPPDADIGPEPHRLDRLFARELHSPPPTPDLPGALKQACPDRPHWKIILFCGPDHIRTWGPELTRELLAPGLHIVDEHGGVAVAITLSADQSAPLQALGFTDPIEVRLAPEAGVWLMTRMTIAPRGALATSL